MKRIEAVNDFVIKFANVNGSGSASANEMFARSVMRMGIPISPRNIFPSNIQGMPTWYELRVSKDGWLGRRGGCDLMVALNPPTVDVVPLSAAISRQKTVELDGDTMHTARELGICFGDRAV
jgi:2-oxoglutarate ferredoxin oxidoreductase subunit alpha